MSDETTEVAEVATEEKAEKVFADLDPETMRTTRLYELCLIFDPAEATRTWDKLAEWVTSVLVGKHGAHIYQIDKFAESRKLAYEINGLKRGTYMVVWFRCKPSAIGEIDREMRLDERSARHMVVFHAFEPPTVGMTAEEFEIKEEPRRERREYSPREGGGGGGGGGYRDRDRDRDRDYDRDR